MARSSLHLLSRRGFVLIEIYYRLSWFALTDGKIVNKAKAFRNLSVLIVRAEACRQLSSSFAPLQSIPIDRFHTPL